jgi:hypothetical protein
MKLTRSIVMSYGSDVEAAIDSMITIALDNYDGSNLDLDYVISDWFDNNFDYGTVFAEGLSYNGIEASDISDLDDAIAEAVQQAITVESVDRVVAEVTADLEARIASLEATIKRLTDALTNATPEPTVFSVMNDVETVLNAYEDTVKEARGEDYTAPYTPPADFTGAAI